MYKDISNPPILEIKTIDDLKSSTGEERISKAIAKILKDRNNE